MISITDSAFKKIVSLLNEENNSELTVRVYVEGGGCSGFSYGFTFDEKMNEDDTNISSDIDTKILVDSTSIQYLDDSTIDFDSGINGKGFVIDNPNVKSTCGCGSSFSVE